MEQSILTELDSFYKKKEDVLKNISLLNNLSDKLTISLQDEERRIYNDKIKEILEHKKTKSANEIELLNLENSKMENYLAFLSKKHELELKYLEQMCEQKSRIEKISDKYSHIDIRNFKPYEDIYKIERRNTKIQSQQPNIDDNNVINSNAPQTQQTLPQVSRQIQPQPPQPPPQPRLPFVSEIQNQDAFNGLKNVKLDSAPSRRSSIGNSLQDHLESALNTKFANVIQGQNTFRCDDSD